MATKRKSDYFGLSYIVSLILAIIPVTSWILGAVTRFTEGKIVAGILRLILGWNIIWILDIVFMIVKKSIFRILPCWYDDCLSRQGLQWQKAGSLRVCLLPFSTRFDDRRREDDLRLVQRFGKLRQFSLIVVFLTNSWDKLRVVQNSKKSAFCKPSIFFCKKNGVSAAFFCVCLLKITTNVDTIII